MSTTVLVQFVPFLAQSGVQSGAHITVAFIRTTRQNYQQAVLLINNILKKYYKLLINLGFNRFISGGALGVDQWAAEIVIELKIVYDIKLIIAKPFPSQDSIWPLSSREHFKNICNQADEVINVSPDPYKNWKMQKRNQYMIDNSKIMIAVWNGLSGGTAGRALRVALGHLASTSGNGCASRCGLGV